ncbi:alpha/beta fold hydrolase [Nocardia rhamnosiphila]
MSVISEKTVSTDGYSSHVLDSGAPDAPAVILLHGGGPGATARTNWGSFIPLLAGDYRVIAPDLVGYGATDHSEELPDSLTAWIRLRVRQVLAVMDELGIGKAHLIGNSMGGSVAMHLVMTAPERFDRISLMGSAGGASTPTPEVIRMVNFYDDPSLEAFEALMRWFVHDEKILGDSFSEIVAQRHRDLLRPEVRRSFRSAFSSPPSQMAVPPAALRRMHHPFLVVHGLQDRFVLPESSIYLQQHLPNAQLHIFDHCGHWVQIEQQTRYVAMLRQFLTEDR